MLAIEQMFSSAMIFVKSGYKIEENAPPAYNTTKKPAKLTIGVKKPLTIPKIKATKASAMMI